MKVKQNVNRSKLAYYVQMFNEVNCFMASEVKQLENKSNHNFHGSILTYYVDTFIHVTVFTYM